MGLSVAGNSPASVKNKDAVEIREAHIVDNLVDGPLDERGVNRDDRNHTAGGKPRRKSDRVFLGDSHVEKPLGKMPRKRIQTRPLGHRRRYACDFLVLPGDFHDFF